MAGSAPMPPPPHCRATPHRLRQMKHTTEPAAATDANEASSMMPPRYVAPGRCAAVEDLSPPVPLTSSADAFSSVGTNQTPESIGPRRACVRHEFRLMKIHIPCYSIAAIERRTNEGGEIVLRRPDRTPPPGACGNGQ